MGWGCGTSGLQSQDYQDCQGLRRGLRSPLQASVWTEKPIEIATEWPAGLPPRSYPILAAACQESADSR